MPLDHGRRRLDAGGYAGHPDSGPAERQAAPPPRGSALRRFLGGSPLAVLLRLLFLSVLVGAAMSLLGLTPGRLFWNLYGSARALADLAAAQIHDMTGWVVAGAVVVVPLWLIARLMSFTR